MIATQQGRGRIQTGLLGAGFAFNPFERLEASNDPYLPEYLIGHEMFAVAWESAPAALFAPAGGGKTAMRIYTLRTCWSGSNQRKKFPISYDLPIFANPGGLITLYAHKLALAAAAATDVLLACAYRPELYLQLSTGRRIHLLSLLKQALPTDLSWSLTILEETASPQQLSSHLDRTYILPEPPTTNEVIDFCRKIQADLEHDKPNELALETLFDSLLEFITQDLAFESVFILLDGVDGTSGLAIDPGAQFRTIAPLCQQALVWAKEHLYLKAFLPQELEPVVAFQAEAFYQQGLHAAINWNITNLADILRRRVFVASRGRFESLDALSSPALRNVETMIAQRVRPLPREAIIMAGRVLDSFLARGGDYKGYLEPRDILQAEQQYRKGTILPEASTP